MFQTQLTNPLLHDLPLIALGLILSAAGIAAFALFGMRWKSRDWRAVRRQTARG